MNFNLTTAAIEFDKALNAARNSLDDVLPARTNRQILSDPRTVEQMKRELLGAQKLIAEALATLNNLG